ncbi:MAG: SDR family oxidoreductase, partial [Polyangiaceae bacterium]|nr:SDR family oxidoreductase [Polyangiaceae bacterium]
MNMSALGNVAVVVGAGSGMGRIHARRLARDGFRVVAVDVDRAGLAETKGDTSMKLEVADVRDLASIRALVERVEDELGPIVALRHTAGIMPTELLLKQDPEVVARVMRVNFEGAVHVASTVVKKMAERGRGSAVFYGSVAGYALTPHMGAYCASKAALTAYIEVLIEETRGSGVSVHLVCPPMVATPLIDQARNTSNPKSLMQATEQNLFADPDDVVDRV